MFSHLQGGRVDISLLQTAARNDLINFLDKCPGEKTIVWDYALEGPTGLIFEYKVLRDHYSAYKMFPLCAQPLPETASPHVIFLVRPKLHLMDLVAKNILDDLKRSSKKKKYHLLFVPQKSSLCTERLKHKGVFGSIVSIEELKWHLFPYDSDVVSMEIPEVFR